MEPTLRAGQIVLVVRKLPKTNDVVVARHPQNGELIIKRLTKIEADGIWLEGDAHTPETAASSSDSWVFGAVRPEAVLGVVYKL